MRNLGHSTPEISLCSFERNTANSGGGMHNEMESHPFIDRCSFFRNTAATQGGGLYSMNGATFVFRSSFHGNRADQGGAVYDDKPRTRLSILSSTFVGNRANVGGAVHLDTQGGHGYIDNCTFARNSSIRGGAIYNRDYAVYLENCILWGDEPEDIATEQTAGGSMSFSDMMGDWPPRLNDDGGNIDIDPIFVREPHDGGDGWGDDTNTPDFDESLNDDFGDLRLQPGSPCIKAGNPDYVAGPGETDLDGHGRMLCGRVDIGAYEFGIGDFDCDYVVDIEDLAGWEGCESDPSALPTLWFLPWSPPAPFLEDGVGDCEAFDFEYDGDVDLMDFAAWQNILGN
jgi:predicted outer membrane repeat protein